MTQEGKPKKVFVRLTESDRDLLEKIAQYEHRHMTQVLEIALHQYALKQGWKKRADGIWD